MWDDEDNNPYGSFGRRDSESGAAPVLSPGGFRAATPPSGSSSPRQDSPQLVSTSQDLSEIDYDSERGRNDRPESREGGYESRVQQWLWQNPDQDILITHAGKNLEGGGSYIAYTIRTGDLEVRRRYSEFAWLRQTIVNLHPTLIIPPIPEKHTMADYASKPTKAKEDAGIIELRKRMLAVFLNRCRRMKEVLDDGVWWRFLDPNASWSEVIHTHPVASIPKNVMKAPPLDTANPTPAHQYLPVPSSSAKLKSSTNTSASGTPTTPPRYTAQPSTAAHTIPGPQLGRFPPTAHNLSEEELDPYFVSYESSSKELETLLQGSMEKVNRRLLNHHSALAEDLAELGARYNAFSLSEQAQSLAAAIEKVGQAVDNTYIATAELSSQLSAYFAEPMRESAQFAGVVRSVLRYRVLKRVQEEMTKDELERKKALLRDLKEKQRESERIQQYLSNTSIPTSSPPKRSTSSASSAAGRSSSERQREEDTASIDSDFPPTHGDAGPHPSAAQGKPAREEQPSSPTNHRKSGSGNFVTNRIFGRINHAIHGIMDVDPERTRQDQIGKTSESIEQLEQALTVAEKDTKDASSGVLKDLKRFQGEKEGDLVRYMIAFAERHIEWAKRNQAAWEEAKAEVENIDVREG